MAGCSLCRTRDYRCPHLNLYRSASSTNTMSWLDESLFMHGLYSSRSTSCCRYSRHTRIFNTLAVFIYSNWRSVQKSFLVPLTAFCTSQFIACTFHVDGSFSELLESFHSSIGAYSDGAVDDPGWSSGL